ncbi:MAG: helix-turn-helix domain-containing protein [Rickettsiales bacterium]|jgi:cytoskeletal protein RodZ|nr:helix-turn-helix domain-containing protein [Rickettsiales bacterium]
MIKIIFYRNLKKLERWLENNLNFKFKKNHRNNFQKENLDYFKDWKLGSMLLSQRESLSMPINVISNILKIKIRDLEAIEQGRLASDNISFYKPGVIRTYAKFLKIDEQIIEQEIKNCCQYLDLIKYNQHKLINIGETDNLNPSKSDIVNSFWLSFIIFFFLLIFYNLQETMILNVSSKIIIEDFEKIKNKNE